MPEIVKPEFCVPNFQIEFAHCPVKSLLAIFRDTRKLKKEINEHNSAEEELKSSKRNVQEHREALARVERTVAMEQISGSIAHELNQPLTGILSSAQAGELLINCGRYDCADMADIIGDIISDAKRAGGVIRNLRDLYRKQNGDFEVVDITSMVEDTLVILHSEFILQNLKVSSSCGEKLMIGHGDRIQLQQVLVNLILNGREAMEGAEVDGRRLDVGASSDGSNVTVWVTDSGPGIDPDKIELIFEPLTTWKPGGTGMDLAISNSIIEAHRGRMIAENRPEGCARVGFVIPTVEAES